MALTEDRAVQLGPFTGGLNNYSQPGAIEDTELVECVNFVPDIDGSLKCRPPFVHVHQNDPGFAFNHVNMVGSGIINGSNHVFASNATGIWAYNGGVWFLVVADVYAADAIQYKNEIYFVAEPASTQPGGKWTGATWVSIPAIPRGQAGLIFKERMWVAPGKHATSNTSRLHFSNIGDPGTWGGADYFDISPGDGQNLVDFIIFNNNLLIFKQGSTYYLSYDAKPADATVTKISNTIGSSNYRCVAQHQQDIYVMHEDNVYQLVNFNWVKISTKVPFVLDTSHPVWSDRDVKTFLSVVGQWLICRYHNRLYVYNTDTQTWSRWSSTDEVLHNFGPLVQMPADDLFNQNESYYAGSCLEHGTAIVRILDGYDNSTVEYSGTVAVDINCSITTKVYSFDIPWKFKRLWSWGVECITNRDVTGTATPFAVNGPPSVITTVPNAGASLLKRMYRFPKGLRFREIQFKIDMLSQGSNSDGPASIYLVLAAVKQVQTVTKRLN